MKNTWLLAVLIVLSIPLISSAQDADPAYDSNPTPDCSSELFDEALHIFRDTLRADAISRERKLSKILKECPDAPWNSQVSDLLNSTREESAEHLFSIAKYYQDLYNSRRQGGLKGAYSRYRPIVEKYPEFSKLDLTLLNLGDAKHRLNITMRLGRATKDLLTTVRALSWSTLLSNDSKRSKKYASKIQINGIVASTISDRRSPTAFTRATAAEWARS